MKEKKTEAAAREEERMAMLERTMKAVCVCVDLFIFAIAICLYSNKLYI